MFISFISIDAGKTIVNHLGNDLYHLKQMVTWGMSDTMGIGTAAGRAAHREPIQVAARGTADSQGPGDTRDATGRTSTPGGRQIQAAKTAASRSRCAVVRHWSKIGDFMVIFLLKKMVSNHFIGNNIIILIYARIHIFGLIIDDQNQNPLLMY